MVPHFHNKLRLEEYDDDHWFLTESLKYSTLVLGYPWAIEVPAYEFPTDLASIPHILRPIIRRGGTHRAAVVHDWLTYRNNHFKKRGRDNITRSQADKIFLEALITSGVSNLKAHAMYAGVRGFSFFFRRGRHD